MPVFPSRPGPSKFRLVPVEFAVIPPIPVPESTNHGLLYNWYAATDPRNICASGWHIPTDEEIMVLGANTGSVYDVDQGWYPTGSEKFKEPFTPPACGIGYSWLCWGIMNYTNEFGFNARGSGWRNATGFQMIGEACHIMGLLGMGGYNLYFYVMGGDDHFYIAADVVICGHSVRPIKDSTSLTHGQIGSYVDPSGYIYPTICIGVQEWVSCNIKTQHYRNGDPIPEVMDNAIWAALNSGALCAYDNDWANV